MLADPSLADVHLKAVQGEGYALGMGCIAGSLHRCPISLEDSKADDWLTVRDWLKGAGTESVRSGMLDAGCLLGKCTHGRRQCSVKALHLCWGVLHLFCLEPLLLWHCGDQQGP